MKTALLIGNGFTSNLIEDYKNPQMMSELYLKEAKICEYADELFAPFRKLDSKILSEEELEKHIITPLISYGFIDSNSLFEKYFKDYGLIHEIQHPKVSSVENLLKIIDLFAKTNEFSSSDTLSITKTANQIYYNTGKNGIDAIPLSVKKNLPNWLSQYNLIYTTNYDCILDEALDTLTNEHKEVMHLHGGFYMENVNKKSKCKLSPEKAYLVWGINGEEKQHQTEGGVLVTKDNRIIMTRDNKMIKTTSLLEGYLSKLRTEEIEQIDILGYSGENDQHINLAIAQNPHIKLVKYFCNPADVSKEIKRIEISKLFSINIEKVALASWDDVWNILNSHS